MRDRESREPATPPTAVSAAWPTRRPADRVGRERPDDTVWAEHWSRHHDDLLRYAKMLLAGDTQAAEDVTQETAIRLWQHSHVLTDDEPITGWLRAVARNIAIDRVRRRRARPTEIALTYDFDQEGQGGLDGPETVDTLTSLLSKLPMRHRTVVFEVYVRDRAIVDVASDLGIPTGTVKSRCHTALRQLRRHAELPVALGERG